MVLPVSHPDLQAPFTDILGIVDVNKIHGFDQLVFVGNIVFRYFMGGEITADPDQGTNLIFIASEIIISIYPKMDGIPSYFRTGSKWISLIETAQKEVFL